MRSLLLFLGLTMAFACVRAQEQENKLVDRLLRPNMELSNPAQNKSFTAVEGVLLDKKFAAREFYSGKKTRPTKSFWGARSFLSKTFGTGKYARAEAAANAKANAELAYVSTQFQSKESALTRESSFARKSKRVNDYSDNRPFLAKGTRQKILDQEHQGHTMTIDEVRDLLNKGR